MATIKKINSWVEWKVLSASNGFEHLVLSFQRIDSTHTKVAIQLPSSNVLADIELVESSVNNIQIKNGNKDSLLDFAISKASIDISSEFDDDRSFVITHPVDLKSGWKFKIGSASATIGTSTAANAIWSGTQCRCHYANGYYWVCFWDPSDSSGNPVIYSSPDKSSWTGQGRIPFTDGRVEAATHWAVRFLGTVMIAALGDDSGNRVYYRKCSLDADGGVTWSQASDDEVGIMTGADACPHAVFQSSSIPWAGGSGASSDELFKIAEGDQLASPSWTNRNTSNVAGEFGSIERSIQGHQVGDTGDLYVIMPLCNSNDALARDLYGAGWDESGTAWNSWDTIKTLDLDYSTQGQRADSTVDGSGNIHLCWIDASGNLNHIIGTVTAAPLSVSWGSESSNIASSAAHTMIVMSNDGTDPYVMYDKGDGKLYYMVYSGGSWGSETEIEDHSGTGLPGAVSAYETVQNSEIGYVYVEGAGSPYNISFNVISLGGGTIHECVANISSKTLSSSQLTRLFSYASGISSKTLSGSNLSSLFNIESNTASKTLSDSLLSRVMEVQSGLISKTLSSSSLGLIGGFIANAISKTFTASQLVRIFGMNFESISKTTSRASLTGIFGMNSVSISKTFTYSDLTVGEIELIAAIAAKTISNAVLDIIIGFNANSSSKSLSSAQIIKTVGMQSSSISKTLVSSSLNNIIGLYSGISSKTRSYALASAVFELACNSISKTETSSLLSFLIDMVSNSVSKTISASTIDKIINIEANLSSKTLTEATINKLVGFYASVISKSLSSSDINMIFGLYSNAISKTDSSVHLSRQLDIAMNTLSKTITSAVLQLTLAPNVGTVVDPEIVSRTVLKVIERETITKLLDSETILREIDNN